MKLLTTLFLTSILLSHNAATAQTATRAQSGTASHSGSAHAGVHGCVKVPDLSSKIPALPGGSTCAKALYTISSVPNIILSDISPIETSTLRTDLGIPTASTFSLAYIDSKVGSGPLAAPHKWYSIQYSGYLADGTKFDSSYDHPDGKAFTFLQGPSGPQGRRMVVVGMDTGIDGMRIGGKRRLFIPFQLGYGPGGNPQAKIPPNSWLIFDIELVAQNDTPPAAPAPPVSATPRGGATPPGSAAPAPGTPGGSTAVHPTTPSPSAQPATPPPASQPAPANPAPTAKPQ